MTIHEHYENFMSQPDVEQYVDLYCSILENRSDNWQPFYYKYIYRYNSQFKVMGSNEFYNKYIKDDFEKEYVPKKFEDICKHFLIKKNKNNEIAPSFFKIGKYYYDLPKQKTNGEFDIVTEDEKGYIFYEVKLKKIK